MFKTNPKSFSRRKQKLMVLIFILRQCSMSTSIAFDHLPSHDLVELNRELVSAYHWPVELVTWPVTVDKSHI